MARCRDQLSQLKPESEGKPQKQVASSVQSRGQDPLECGHCGSDRLILIEETRKPSWRELFDYQSEQCPAWFAKLKREDDRRFWDNLIGEGFNDWYLETVIESAKKPVTIPPPVQRYLPGISPWPDYHLEYF